MAWFKFLTTSITKPINLPIFSQLSFLGQISSWQGFNFQLPTNRLLLALVRIFSGFKLALFLAPPAAPELTKQLYPQC
jgi:hypothetical protein